jgi:hypothetical protein
LRRYAEAGYFDHPGGYLSFTPHIPGDIDLQKFIERSHPAARDDTFPPIATLVGWCRVKPVLQARYKTSLACYQLPIRDAL